MNNLSINRTYFNRGDAEARRKTWSEVANLRSGRVIVTHSPNLLIVLRVSAPPRFETFCSFLFQPAPGQCVARNDTLRCSELLLD